MTEQWFDYEALGHCQYGVPSRSTPSGYADCQEPALYRIWWGEKGGEMLVCQEHFDFAKETEIKARQGEKHD